MYFLLLLFPLYLFLFPPLFLSPLSPSLSPLSLSFPSLSLSPSLSPSLSLSLPPLSLYREWYSYHFPELIKIVPDNLSYAKVAQYIGNRKDFTADKMEGLEELLMDSTKAETIFEAAKMSMGGHVH